MVESVGAYVEGLPTPSSSIFLIKLASLYLAGGWVKCCSFLMSRSFILVPSANSGRILGVSSSSSFTPTIFDTASHPSNSTVDPVALKIYPSSEPIDKDVCSYIDGFIWHSKLLNQTIEYVLNSSPASPILFSGTRDAKVGL